MVLDIKGSALPPTAFSTGDAAIVDNAGTLRKVTLGDLATKSIPASASDYDEETDTLLAVRSGDVVRVELGDVGGGGGAFDVLDEDDFASNSATDAPSQQSTKAYVDAGLTTKAASSHTHAATGISDSTAAGRALLTAADVAAQQTALGLADAGEIYAEALIDAYTLTARQALMANSGGTDFEAVTLGTAAELDAIPSGAPTTFTQAAGAITLDFDGIDEGRTTTSANITTITFDNIASYSTVIWHVTHTTARNITFPAGTVMFGNSGSLTHVGSANSRYKFLIRNDNGTYEVVCGDAGVVGS
jgi:hypothetical protein